MNTNIFQIIFYFKHIAYNFKELKTNFDNQISKKLKNY